MRLQDSIEINSPPEKTWPFLTNQERILLINCSNRRFSYPKRTWHWHPLIAQIRDIFHAKAASVFNQQQN